MDTPTNENAENKEITTVDEYIASFDPTRQTKLTLLRYIIIDELPEVEEKIVLGIPTYYYQGRLFSFAGQQGHFYFYPGKKAVEAYMEDVEPYLIAKNTLGFKYDAPIPEETIKLLINYRVDENLAK